METTCDSTSLKSCKKIIGEGSTEATSEMAKVTYKGYLSKDFDFEKTEQTAPTFDETSEGDYFSFPVGKGRVISCWDEQIATMKIGEVATIQCPSSTAYGSRGVGQIPPNSDLTFQVKRFE